MNIPRFIGTDNGSSLDPIIGPGSRKEEGGGSKIRLSGSVHLEG